ncbi:MAG: DUF1186 domain-containing protein [Prolixibacteraceae bacterium]|jgi:hypothetical protein|nr:DUF1186 domain-containing protein [Prolixibacteraceae bacterium]
MTKQYKKYNYQITTDPDFQNKRFGITPELNRQLESLYYEIEEKKNKKIIEKLTTLIVKHPTVPILKNYLSVAYNIQGNHKKGVEVNNWLLAEHPDYLFAKINQANVCIEKEEFAKVPLILGEAMELKELYPERDIFHLAEITGFFKVSIRYFAAIENLELAENRIEIMKELAPDHHDTQEAETYLFLLRLQNAALRIEEEEKKRISPKKAKLALTRNTKKDRPIFNHTEIEILYQYGLEIPHNILREIIALPRHSLIEDLEKILEDAVERYSWFKKLEYEEETQSFVLHAIFLLKEIKAEESLPKILSFLEFDDEFLENWLGGHITDTIWQCLFCLGINNTALFKPFLLKPGIDTYSKTAVSHTLCQIVLHHPERKEEILAIYTEIFKRFAKATIEDNIIDSDFLGLAICHTIDCQLPELLPVIKPLYEKQYVSLGITGNYKEVEIELGKLPAFNQKLNIQSIFELYTKVLDTWSGYNEDKNSDFNTSKIPQQAVSVKINRNDPCPCESGKKYKKCCGK